MPLSERFRWQSIALSLQPKSDGVASTHWRYVSVCIIWNQTVLIPSDRLPAAGSPAEGSVLLLQISGFSRKSHVSFPSPSLYFWSHAAILSLNSLRSILKILLCFVKSPVTNRLSSCLIMISILLVNLFCQPGSDILVQEQNRSNF